MSQRRRLEEMRNAEYARRNRTPQHRVDRLDRRRPKPLDPETAPRNSPHGKDDEAAEVHDIDLPKPTGAKRMRDEDLTDLEIWY